jgi:hypothetical protein
MEEKLVLLEERFSELEARYLALQATLQKYEKSAAKSQLCAEVSTWQNDP